MATKNEEEVIRGRKFTFPDCLEGLHEKGKKKKTKIKKGPKIIIKVDGKEVYNGKVGNIEFELKMK